MYSVSGCIMSDSRGFKMLKRFFVGVLTVAAVITMLLLILPELIKAGAIYGLKKAGADEVTIEDVDLNLFAGTASIVGVEVGSEGVPEFELSSLMVEVQLLPLLDRRVELDSIILSGMNIHVKESHGGWHVVVPIPPAESSGEETADDVVETPWGIGLHRVILERVDVSVDAVGVVSSASIEKLELSDLQSWAPSSTSAISVIGSINGSPIDINVNAQPFAKIPTAKTHIIMDRLSLAPLAPFVKEFIPGYKGAISMDTYIHVAVSDNGDMELTQTGKVSVDLDGLEHPAISIGKADVAWDGTVRVEVPLGEEPLIKASGKLTSTTLSAELVQAQLALSHRGIAWEGESSIDLDDVEQSLQVSGSLSIEDVMVEDRELALSPLQFTQFQLQGLTVQGGADLAIGSVSLKQAQLLVSGAEEKKESVLAFAEIQVSNSSLKNQDTLFIGDVLVSGVNAKLTLLEGGKLEKVNDYIDTLTARFSVESSGSEVAGGNADVEQALQYAVNRIRLDSNNRIYVTDTTIAPHYREQVFIDALEVGRLDSNAPNELTAVDAVVRIGEFSTIDVKGQLTPLAGVETIDGEITLKVTGLDLTAFSAYVESASGYAIGTGQFNLDTVATVKSGEVHADNKVLLKQLILTPQDEALIASVSKQLTMPVGVSLGLLKDSDGNIELSIPLDGDLNDPSVSISSVVQLAFVQAMKKGSLSYLKYAIQPYGAILLVGEQVGEMVMEIKLAPLRFEEGLLVITAEDQQYLPKLVTFLNNRPAVSLKVCPIVTPADLLEGERNEMNDRLIALASGRLSAIKQKLVAEHHIAPERVLLCRAVFGEGTPRVELEL